MTSTVFARADAVLVPVRCAVLTAPYGCRARKGLHAFKSGDFELIPPNQTFDICEFLTLGGIRVRGWWGGRAQGK